VEDDRVAEITTFGWAKFPDYGLPLVCEEDGGRPR
jgi:hypothetical protein